MPVRFTSLTGGTMDMLKIQADIAKVHAETVRLLDEVQKTRLAEQRWTLILSASAFLAVGTGFAAICVQFAKLFPQWSN
jgi:hypothetical protein